MRIKKPIVLSVHQIKCGECNSGTFHLVEKNKGLKVRLKVKPCTDCDYLYSIKQILLQGLAIRLTSTITI